MTARTRTGTPARPARTRFFRSVVPEPSRSTR
ncbi:hypothetical protein EDD38_3368 [Kitasatospora cineracea]|uniref:Uncharacterized protein n=1 Tax=Kitasatospora cineracea TaxID=88074 RepID=A0A3N4RNM7_9ACTN|nr:hypothetical protein EDD38_3368 [Kitasatospora cineracea]